MRLSSSERAGAAARREGFAARRLFLRGGVRCAGSIVSCPVFSDAAGGMSGSRMHLRRVAGGRPGSAALPPRPASCFRRRRRGVPLPLFRSCGDCAFPPEARRARASRGGRGGAFALSGSLARPRAAKRGYPAEDHAEFPAEAEMPLPADETAIRPGHPDEPLCPGPRVSCFCRNMTPQVNCGCSGGAASVSPRPTEGEHFISKML